MTKQKAELLIVGSGAIGLLWYCHFFLNSKNSVNPYLYQSAKRNKLPKLIKFTDIDTIAHTIPSKSLALAQQPIDIIMICVKSYQVNQAIADIKHLITPDTLIIITHNGLGALNNETLQLLEHTNVLDMLTTHGCLRVAPDEIIHTGVGVSHLGIKDDLANSFKGQSRIKTTTSLLHTTLPEVVWCNDILSKQWVKLAINCVINPLTAVLDIKNGRITEKRFVQTIEKVIDEIIEVAHVKAIELDKTQLIQTVLLVAEKTANNSSSMRCDVQQNRKTEIEYINGYIHKLGQEFNIPTPKNTELYKQVLALK